MLKFVNREEEKSFLNQEFKSSNLLVLLGRRRVGKSRLLSEWLKGQSGFKSIVTKAIKGTESVQLTQIFDDLDRELNLGVKPSSYMELFRLLEIYGQTLKEPLLIVIDEFPYLAQESESLTSIIQNWLDKNEGGPIRLCLLGSAQAMMYKTFLNESSPLYKRARRLLKMKPLNYVHFCECLDLEVKDQDNFIKYSMVGGVPKYWQYLDASHSIFTAVEDLFFNEFSFFESEPDTILGDEGVTSSLATAILHAIGRGAVRPADISKRIGIKATDLSRPLKLLLDTFIVRLETPFGTTERDSKARLYFINDFALMFWFEIFAPHRSRWLNYDQPFKEKLLRDHASRVLEITYRQSIPNSRRYWENPTKSYRGCEFDCIYSDPENQKDLIIDEIKWSKPNLKTSLSIQATIEEKFKNSKLPGMGYKLAQTRVLGIDDVIKTMVG